ncbi:MAG: response regulator [Gemmatimonadaceae bacterium]
MIRVGVVDDQTLVRQGLCSLLALTPDLRVTFEAADGEQALRILRDDTVDVLLLDVRMPRMTGPQVLRALEEVGRQPPTIVLTTFDDDDALVECLGAGAKGFLLKDVTLERLASAVRIVAGGGTVIQPALTERAVRSLRARGDTGAAGSVDLLSYREVQILRLLVAGYSNREIADALRLAEGTVKNYTSSILSKLGVRDRTRAVLKALELGLIG